MATNLNIDPSLIEEARNAGGFRTKKEAVEAALREFVRHHACRQALEGFGTFEFDPEYDYKGARAAR
jgi:Arc/MetJ family transcription regulator